MADWRQIQARIRKAKAGADAAAKLAELYEHTRDAMVAFELARWQEKAGEHAEAARWYTAAAERFRRSQWRSKAEAALARLRSPSTSGTETVEEAASPQSALETSLTSSGASTELSGAEIGTHGGPPYVSEAQRGAVPESPSELEKHANIGGARPAAADQSVQSADDGGRATRETMDAPAQIAEPLRKRSRRRGRRGGRNRARTGHQAASGTAVARTHTQAQIPHVEEPPTKPAGGSFMPAQSGPESTAPEEPATSQAESPVAAWRARSRAGEPALASRMAQLESQLRRLLACPQALVEQAETAPAGPGVLLLSDSDQVTHYYVESCQTLRIAIGNLVRGGRAAKDNPRLKERLAENLGIAESRVTNYLKQHCAVRWLQLDEGASELAHFAIAVLRPAVND